MFNFDYITKEDIKEHNPSWPKILDHPYIILIVGSSASGKTSALLNLINLNQKSTQSYFTVPKNIRINSRHYFVVRIPNKREIQQTPFNHSSDLDFKDFMNLYKICTAKPHSFLVINATLSSGKYSRFRKNLLERI